jgi:hypothetical protein
MHRKHFKEAVGKSRLNISWATSMTAAVTQMRLPEEWFLLPSIADASSHTLNSLA